MDELKAVTAYIKVVRRKKLWSANLLVRKFISDSHDFPIYFTSIISPLSPQIFGGTSKSHIFRKDIH